MKFIIKVALVVIIILLIFFMFFKNKKALAPTVVEEQNTPEETQTTKEGFSITSSAFGEGEFIPQFHTCDGENTNPPLMIADIPEDTISLALIMDDPDVPAEVLPERMFDHWVLFNIDPSTTSIPEGVTGLGIEGINGSGSAGYTGPCPPTQYEPTTHRYFFKLYALDMELDITEGASKSEVEAAMEGHILSEAQLMGRYDRSGN